MTFLLESEVDQEGHLLLNPPVSQLLLPPFRLNKRQPTFPVPQSKNYLSICSLPAKLLLLQYIQDLTIFFFFVLPVLFISLLGIIVVFYLASQPPHLLPSSVL